MKYVASVISFLSGKHIKAVEIHREISEVYGENIRSDGMVWEWVRGLKMAAWVFMIWNEMANRDNAYPHMANQTQDIIGNLTRNNLITLHSVPI